MREPEVFARDGMSDEDVSAFVAATLGMKPQTEGFSFARGAQYMGHYLRGLTHKEAQNASEATISHESDVQTGLQ